MRRSARVDTNQASIVTLLRSIGALVLDLSGVGDGCADLLVFHPRSGLWLAEIKDGSLPPSKRALTPAEQWFHTKWSSAPLYVVTDDQSALAALQDAAKRYGGE